jgi:hypothetical protein
MAKAHKTSGIIRPTAFVSTITFFSEFGLWFINSVPLIKDIQHPFVTRRCIATTDSLSSIYDENDLRVAQPVTNIGSYDAWRQVKQEEPQTEGRIGAHRPQQRCAQTYSERQYYFTFVSFLPWLMQAHRRSSGVVSSEYSNDEPSGYTEWFKPQVQYSRRLLGRSFRAENVNNFSDSSPFQSDNFTSI